MHDHTKIYVALVALALWLLGWLIVGFLAGDRLGKPNLGALLGFLFGPFVLFVFMLPSGRGEKNV